MSYTHRTNFSHSYRRTLCLPCLLSVSVRPEPPSTGRCGPSQHSRSVVGAFAFRLHAKRTLSTIFVSNVLSLTPTIPFYSHTTVHSPVVCHTLFRSQTSGMHLCCFSHTVPNVRPSEADTAFRLVSKEIPMRFV